MADMYFMALVTPKEVNEDVLKWKQFMKEHYECAVALRSPAHITLIPPFWMEERLEQNIEKSIHSFSQQQDPFEIRLENFAAFKPRVIYVDVVPGEALSNLHLQLHDHLIETGLFPIKKEERPYHPHVTIATRDLRKKSFNEAWNIFKEKKYEASWVTNGISLLRHNQKKWEVIFTSQFK
jgi:2'-5' RNA ligase